MAKAPEPAMTAAEQQQIRDHAIEFHKHMDVFGPDHYTERVKKEIKKTYILEQVSGPPPEPIVSDDPDDLTFISASDREPGQLIPFNSVHKVYEKDEKTGQKKFVCEIHIDEKGVAKPVPPNSMGWDALVDTYKKEFGYSTMTLNVSANPYNRVDAISTLLNMTQVCIKRGAAAQPGENAQKFLDSIGPNDPLAGAKASLEEAMAISRLKLAGSRIQSASDPVKSWVVTDAAKIETNAIASDTKIDALIVDDDAAHEDQIIRGMMKELDSSFTALNATHNRLVNEHQSEVEILKDPKLLAKGDGFNQESLNNYYPDREKESFRRDLTGITGKPDRPKQEYADNFAKYLNRDIKEGDSLNKVDIIEKLNNPAIVANKTRAIDVVETERARLSMLKDGLSDRINASGLADKDTLKKDLGKYDALNTNGKMQTELASAKKWNADANPTTPALRTAAIDNSKQKVKDDYKAEVAARPWHSKRGG